MIWVGQHRCNGFCCNGCCCGGQGADDSHMQEIGWPQHRGDHLLRDPADCCAVQVLPGEPITPSHRADANIYPACRVKSLKQGLSL
eukprot:324879-Amphidinium_carterae.1